MTFVFLGLMWVTFIVQQVSGLFIDRMLWYNIFTLNTVHPEYVWTWVVSVFAHGSPVHIFFNSIVIFFFGRLVEQIVGWKKFAVLFLVSGVLAGMGQVAVNSVIGGPGVIGASGAALALMGVLTILKPDLTVYLYFVIPVPIWLLTGGTAVISLVAILSGAPGLGGIAHVAHFVGLAIGAVYGYQIKGRARVPNQVQFGGGPGGPGGPGRRRF